MEKLAYRVEMKPVKVKGQDKLSAHVTVLAKEGSDLPFPMTVSCLPQELPQVLHTYEEGSWKAFRINDDCIWTFKHADGNWRGSYLWK